MLHGTQQTKKKMMMDVSARKVLNSSVCCCTDSMSQVTRLLTGTSTVLMTLASVKLPPITSIMRAYCKLNILNIFSVKLSSGEVGGTDDGVGGACGEF